MHVLAPVCPVLSGQLKRRVFQWSSWCSQHFFSIYKRYVCLYGSYTGRGENDIFHFSGLFPTWLQLPTPGQAEARSFIQVSQEGGRLRRLSHLLSPGLIRTCIRSGAAGPRGGWLHLLEHGPGSRSQQNLSARTPSPAYPRASHSCFRGRSGLAWAAAGSSLVGIRCMDLQQQAQSACTCPLTPTPGIRSLCFCFPVQCQAACVYGLVSSPSGPAVTIHRRCVVPW